MTGAVQNRIEDFDDYGFDLEHILGLSGRPVVERTSNATGLRQLIDFLFARGPIGLCDGSFHATIDGGTIREPHE